MDTESLGWRLAEGTGGTVPRHLAYVRMRYQHSADTKDRRRKLASLAELAEHLPSPLRAVARLTLRGYHTAEVAERLGITENAVDIRLHHARKRLVELEQRRRECGEGGSEMGTSQDNRGFTEMWRRVTRDPLLPALQDAYARGASPVWWVEWGRIVTPTAMGDGVDGASAAVELAALPPGGFIGRARERATARNLVPQTPLLTITGEPGIGKTRLALETTAAVASLFADGVTWIDLSGVTYPELVGIEVSSRLDVQQGSAGSIVASDQQADRPFVERLADKLRGLRMLLVLDGCEHVREGCEALLEALQAACPSVHVLCTSREPVGVEGECTLPLLPLSVPPHPRLDVEDALVSDSVQLFLDRARAVRDTPLSDAELLVVMELCRRLKGVPRAIELVAGETADTPLQEIRDRLDDQSITECAYHRLSGDQQLLLRRLSVFRDGFQAEAAVDVCADDLLTAAEIRSTLDALVDASLLLYDPFQSPPRYKLPEPVREYAEERLLRSGEAKQLRARHRRRFLQLAQQVSPRLYGPNQVEALDLLESELDNIRAALDFDDGGSAAQSLRIACLLQRLWVIRGLLSEGRMHVERALAAVEGGDPWRVRGFTVASKLANNVGDFDDAKRWGDAARESARDLGLRGVEAVALRELGIEAHRRGRLDAAESLLLEALTISRAEKDRASEAICLTRLSAIYEWNGDMAGARAAEEDAVAIARGSGDMWSLAWSLYWLGLRNADQGRHGVTKELLEEALLLSQRLGSRQLTVLVLVAIGRAAHLRRDLTAAEDHFSEAIGAARSLEEPTSYFLAVAGLAGVEIARGSVEAARRWLDGHDADAPLVRRLARAALLAGHARLAVKTGDRASAELLHRRALGLWYRLRELRRVTEHLEELGLLAAERHEPCRAATLVAASARFRHLTEAPSPWEWSADAGRARQDLSTSSDAAVRAAWQRGTRLGVDDVIAFALSSE